MGGHTAGPVIVFNRMVFYFIKFLGDIYDSSEEQYLLGYNAM
jgi:hypothetical protein